MRYRDCVFVTFSSLNHYIYVKYSFTNGNLHYLLIIFLRRQRKKRGRSRGQSLCIYCVYCISNPCEDWIIYLHMKLKLIHITILFLDNNSLEPTLYFARGQCSIFHYKRFGKDSMISDYLSSGLPSALEMESFLERTKLPQGFRKDGFPVRKRNRSKSKNRGTMCLSSG